jgi:hypothetical protein
MQGGLLLDVVIAECSAILKLHKAARIPPTKTKRCETNM